MRLKILTPNSTVLEQSCNQVIVDAVNGKMGILKNHCALTTILEKGEIRIQSNNEWKSIEANSGLLKIENNEILILLEN
ncbi:MAG: F0F1 ATP synthase subunit epsilon [Fibrobacter sp.]|nr:F0F1 ATP synthase subunit epsilon [Fibrobacter sp.]